LNKASTYDDVLERQFNFMAIPQPYLGDISTLFSSGMATTQEAYIARRHFLQQQQQQHSMQEPQMGYEVTEIGNYLLPDCVVPSFCMAPNNYQSRPPRQLTSKYPDRAQGIPIIHNT